MGGIIKGLFRAFLHKLQVGKGTEDNGHRPVSLPVDSPSATSTRDPGRSERAKVEGGQGKGPGRYRVFKPVAAQVEPPPS